jgi:hypothetical protein
MQCGARFRDAFLADNYSQVRANNEDEYTTLIDMFPYRNAVLEEAKFPRTLPYSSMVPVIFSEVR